MKVLFVLFCYAIGSFFSFLIVNYVNGYRNYDKIDSQMNCLIATLIYPIFLPGLMLFPYFVRIGKYITGFGKRAHDRAVADREAKNLKSKPVLIDEPTSYRTFEKVKSSVGPGFQ